MVIGMITITITEKEARQFMNEIGMKIRIEGWNNIKEYQEYYPGTALVLMAIKTELNKLKK